MGARSLSAIAEPKGSHDHGAGLHQRLKATCVFPLAACGIDRRREQLCGSEVEQAGRAIVGDEDVVGLEVAMDYEVLVGELDGVADAFEEC